MKTKNKKKSCRANGQGTLEKRGCYWLARWTVNGKHYSRSTKCEERKEAEKKLAEFVKPYQASSEIEIIENLAAKVRVIEKTSEVKESKDKPIEVRYLVDVYADDLNTSKISDGTKSLYESVLNQFIKSCSKKLAHEVTSNDAKAFLQTVKSNTCEAHYNCVLTTMKRLFKVAMSNDNNIKSNPFSEWKCLKLAKIGNRRELSDDEISRIVKYVTENLSEEYQLVFALGIYAGLRLSDCANLKWSSVDFMARRLRVLPIKTKRTGKMAIVPMHPVLASMLSSVKREDELVLPKIANEYKTGKLAYVISKVFRGAGIKVCDVGEDGKRIVLTGFHSFRHTFASRCMRAGIPVNQVQTMMAHSKADMSLHYSHVKESDLSLPDFDSNLVEVKLSKKLVEFIMSKAAISETVEDCLKRVLGYGCNVLEAKAIDVA